MNDPQKSKKYVLAKGPVNSRTTTVQQPRALPSSPIVKARMQMAKAKQLLGTPLATRLSTPHSIAKQHAHATPALVLQAIGCTVGGTGVLLGLIQKSLLIAGASAVVVCAFGLWAYVGAQARRRDAGSFHIDSSSLVDAGDVERLDAAMEKLAAQTSQDTIDRLSSLKESIMRCLQLLGSAQILGGISSEDHLYIRECIRRYIPDSINGCLQVPQKDRATLVIDGKKPALDLLHDQIDMIRSQLDIKELRLTQLAGESLMQQHNFLSAKTSTKT